MVLSSLTCHYRTPDVASLGETDRGTRTRRHPFAPLLQPRRLRARGLTARGVARHAARNTASRRASPCRPGSSGEAWSGSPRTRGGPRSEMRAGCVGRGAWRSPPVGQCHLRMGGSADDAFVQMKNVSARSRLLRCYGKMLDMSGAAAQLRLGSVCVHALRLPRPRGEALLRACTQFRFESCRCGAGRSRQLETAGGHRREPANSEKGAGLRLTP